MRANPAVTLTFTNFTQTTDDSTRFELQRYGTGTGASVYAQNITADAEL